LHQPVHHDAVQAVQARGLRQRDLGHGADAGDQQVYRMLHVVDDYAAHAAVLGPDVLQVGGQAQVDAGLVQHAGDVVRGFGRHGAR